MTAGPLLAVAFVGLSCGDDRPLTAGGAQTARQNQDNGVVGASAGSCPKNAVAAGDVVRLAAVRNQASPLPDPTGIASDGTGFWIIAGGHNASVHTLVHFDPNAISVDRTFTFQNLIEQLGTGVYGLAWDGAALWISVSGNTNKLVKVDPQTGQITRTMSSPTDLGPSDLDFDGTDLWLSSGTGDVYRLDRTTGGIQQTFRTSPASLGRDSGIAFTAGQLWVGDLFGGLEVHDASTGTLLATVTSANGSSFTQDTMGSSTFAGCQLVIASGIGITYYDIQTSR